MTRRDRLREWKQSGSELVAQIEAELRAKIANYEALAGEIDEIRSDLAELRACLPHSTPRVAEPVTTRAVLQGMPSIVVRDIEVASDATIADLVRAALETADEPIPAKAVAQRISVARPIDADDVHRALYRLKEAGEVEVTGVRPHSLYALRPRQPDAQTAIQIVG